IYIPHRIEEGYGLNADALRSLRAQGVELVVTVDCGVAAPDEARVAAEIGLELVVTDHHEPKASGELPVARAVVHPRIGGAAAGGFGELCGAGVAWKLAWMLGEIHGGSARLPEVLRNRLRMLLPLAAIGTIADVVPLRGENRIIVARGLLEVRRTGIPGLDALLSASCGEDPIDAEKVAFRIAPRINACGRMQHANEAVELVTTASRARIAEIVALTERLNSARREEQDAIFADASARLAEATRDGARPRGIVLSDESWNLGVVGIVCSKLVERFACPAILFTRSPDGGYKGSGRSLAGVDLHEVLGECGEHLAGYGGHAMAAGVRAADSAQVERFREAFVRACDARLPAPEEQRPVLEVDCECELAELDIVSLEAIERLAPWGRENPKPRLVVRDAEVTDLRIFGKSQQHLELTLRHEGARKGFLRAQRWDGAPLAASIARKSRVDIVIEPEINTFRGVAEVRARLIDLGPSGSAARLFPESVAGDRA
ncbi:MAG: single-stranded-DNA-specific exonuclease RecJ, partial [Planctomycetota bacterium]